MAFLSRATKLQLELYIHRFRWQIIKPLAALGKKVLDRISHFIDIHLEAAALYIFDHKWEVLGADAAISTLSYFTGFGEWVLWAHILLTQNWAFTYVSRARNSGSLTRHLKAGFFSNYVWWLSQVVIFTKLFAALKGQHGIRVAVITGLYYTAFTLTGSILSHAQALRTEKGKAAVGASKKYAQIPVEDWERVKAIVDKLEINVPNRWAAQVGSTSTVTR